MKLINNLVVFLLCLMLIGFFANFAENDYGMELVMMCCLGISILLHINLIVMVRPAKLLSTFSLIGILCSLPVFLGSLFLQASNRYHLISETAAVTIYVMSLFVYIGILMILIPLAAQKRNIKNNLKLNYFAYYEILFSAFFCLGIYLKNNHEMGASVVMMVSSLILIPYIILVGKNIINFKKANAYDSLSANTVYLFIGLTFLAYVFKSQHWPGADNMVTLVSQLFLFIIVWSINLLVSNKKNLFSWWNQERFVARALLITFFFTTAYVNLRRMELLPQIYSNQYPKAYQELKEKSNNITREGKLYSEKSETYYKYFNEFFRTTQDMSQK